MSADPPDLVIRAFRPGDEEPVVEVWRLCDLVVAHNDPRDDLVAKLRVQPELMLVGVVGERLVATVMVGYDGHRGWINYLGVLPEWQRKGIGRRMIESAERRLRELGCPKINLQIRAHNQEVIGFYEQLGFLEEGLISMGKRLGPKR